MTFSPLGHDYNLPPFPIAYGTVDPSDGVWGDEGEQGRLDTFPLDFFNSFQLVQSVV